MTSRSTPIVPRKLRFSTALRKLLSSVLGYYHPKVLKDVHRFMKYRTFEKCEEVLNPIYLVGQDIITAKGQKFGLMHLDSNGWIIRKGVPIRLRQLYLSSWNGNSFQGNVLDEFRSYSIFVGATSDEMRILGGSYIPVAIDLVLGIFHEMIHARTFVRAALRRFGRSVKGESRPSLQTAVDTLLKDEVITRIIEKKFAFEIGDPRTKRKLADIKDPVEKVKALLARPKRQRVARSIISPKPHATYVESAVFGYLEKELREVLSPEEIADIESQVYAVLVEFEGRLILVDPRWGKGQNQKVLVRDLSSPLHKLDQYGKILFDANVFSSQSREGIALEYAQVYLAKKVVGIRWDRLLAELQAKKFNSATDYFVAHEKILNEHLSKLFGHLHIKYP